MAKFDIDEALVRKLAALLNDTDLTEIEYRAGEKTIRVSRGAGGMAFAPTPSAAPPAIEGEKENSGPNFAAVTAPMVGVVYLAPEPGSPNFIKPGDTVSEGQTLLLIEAMKTFNPIRAPRDGRVSRILV
ncbi:acetyl-CoA carboxylase biotin carboxyl carrier protein, partial [Alphaproteobacteria bacterium]|nr:acetyl-CoA carboxylase biotin carboxyl carrier protein [Alphaproteobacteria bacterium]